MATARIVTDSSADLTPEVVSDLGITVVPLQVNLGTEMLSDGPGLRSADFYRRVIKSKAVLTISSPTARQFATTYADLAKETDDIVSIHLSARLNGALQAAHRGRAGFLGRCQIQVIDSHLVSRALGILAGEAARAAQSGMHGSEIMRLVRGLIPRLYFVFYVETPDYLRRSGLLHVVRESVPGVPSIKPLLILEEGEITPLQRLRNRGRPTERLLEFVAEFTTLKHLSVLHSGLGTDLSEFKTQLAELFPKQIIEEHIYGPTLGAYLGPAALGVVAFEG